MQKTPAEEALQKANDELSHHCYQTGNLHYVIKNKEADLEKARAEFHNLGVNFKKLSETFQAALAAVAEEKKAKAAEEAAKPEPALSLVPEAGA